MYSCKYIIILQSGIHTNIKRIIPSICICIHVSIPGLLYKYHW